MTIAWYNQKAEEINSIASEIKYFNWEHGISAKIHEDIVWRDWDRAVKKAGEAAEQLDKAIKEILCKSQ